MIIDITGTLLTPGNFGKDCLGNGEHDDIECCCDECDYLICCTNYNKLCDRCFEKNDGCQNKIILNIVR